MPASYVHQSVAVSACRSLSLFSSPLLRAAVLAGAEGPDPFFFSIRPMPGKPFLPRLGAHLHARKTDDFLLTLADCSKSSELTRAYCCGFFAHYAADTTLHPFIYAHSLTKRGAYSSMAHASLEHALETLLFRRQGHENGQPGQMRGFALLAPHHLDEIASALSLAVQHVFPDENAGVSAIRRSFDDCIRICRLLQCENGGKNRLSGAVLSALGHLAPFRANMTPQTSPAGDIANDAHAAWSSIWQPDVKRTESFSDLCAAAVSRAASLINAANGCMCGRVSFSSLRALHGGFSYASGLPWQTTCAAGKAPGCTAR